MANLASNQTTSSYVIIPKVFRQDKDIGGTEDANFEQVKNTLKNIGLEELNTSEKPIDSDKGKFTSFNEMNATAVSFSSQEEKEKARQQLEEKNDFVPDFPLSVPEISSNQGKLTTPECFWPDNTGINQEHADGNKGDGVLIGVLDTGIDADHPEFQFYDQNKHVKFRYFSTISKSVRPYRDVRGFDIHGHGTKICGVIAGKNVGIAPDTQLYVAGVLGNGIESSLSRVFSGLEWLFEEFTKDEDENKNKPKIINMSIDFSESDLKEFFPTVRQMRTTLNELRDRIVKLIERRNILVVAAIGNSGEGNVAYPGAFEEVLAVGAVDRYNKIWNNSGSGLASDQKSSKPDVVGYGVNVCSCFERDYDGNAYYAKNSGTSLASAYVTGVAALYWAKNKELSSTQVRENLISMSLGTKLDRNRFGQGLVALNPNSKTEA